MKFAAGFLLLFDTCEVVQDFKYFQRIKWQYMILDEAQAIKSSTRCVFVLFCVRNATLLLFHGVGVCVCVCVSSSQV